MGYTLLHNNIAYPASRAEPSTGGRDGRGNWEGGEMLCDKGGCHVGITGSKGCVGDDRGWRWVVSVLRRLQRHGDCVVCGYWMGEKAETIRWVGY
jgi:hypothetical protein